MEHKPIILTGKIAEKVTRWLRHEFTDEELEKMKELKKRSEELKKKWNPVWDDEKK